jgi:hypothetical protein
MNKWAYMKLKSFYTTKEMVLNWRDHPWSGALLPMNGLRKCGIYTQWNFFSLKEEWNFVNHM